MHQQHKSCGIINIFQKQNFCLAPHHQFGGSSQKNCMLSRFVNFMTILSLQSPRRRFPFFFPPAPLLCCAWASPRPPYASQFQSTWFPSLLGTSYPTVSLTRDFSITYFSCSQLQERWVCRAHTEPGNSGLLCLTKTE
jgi:hypothetical protein